MWEQADKAWVSMNRRIEVIMTHTYLLPSLNPCSNQTVNTYAESAALDCINWYAEPYQDFKIQYIRAQVDRWISIDLGIQSHLVLSNLTWLTFAKPCFHQVVWFDFVWIICSDIAGPGNGDVYVTTMPKHLVSRLTVCPEALSDVPIWKDP